MDVYVLYERFGFIPWQKELTDVEEVRENGEVRFINRDASYALVVDEDRLIDIRAKKNLSTPNLSRTIDKCKREDAQQNINGG